MNRTDRSRLGNVSGATVKEYRGTYRELARLVVDADVGDVHGVRRGGDGRATRRAQHAAHEGAEGALLLAAVRLPVLHAIALIAVPVARALGARWRGIHLAGELLERGRLAQAGALLEARGLRAVGGLRVQRARRAELLGAAVRGCAGDDVGKAVSHELVAGGQAASRSRGRVVEAVCATRIDGAGLGERSEQRGASSQAGRRRGRVAAARGWRDAKARLRGVAARALEVGRSRRGALELACSAVLVIVADGRRRARPLLLAEAPVCRLAVSVVHGC